MIYSKYTAQFWNAPPFLNTHVPLKGPGNPTSELFSTRPQQVISKEWDYSKSKLFLWLAYFPASCWSHHHLLIVQPSPETVQLVRTTYFFGIAGKSHLELLVSSIQQTLRFPQRIPRAGKLSPTIQHFTVITEAQLEFQQKFWTPRAAQKKVTTWIPAGITPAPLSVLLFQEAVSLLPIIILSAWWSWAMQGLPLPPYPLRPQPSPWRPLQPDQDHSQWTTAIWNLSNCQNISLWWMEQIPSSYEFTNSAEMKKKMWTEKFTNRMLLIQCLGFQNGIRWGTRVEVKHGGADIFQSWMMGTWEFNVRFLNYATFICLRFLKMKREK